AANQALPLRYAREQGLAEGHQLVYASPQLRGRLLAGEAALPGRDRLSPQANQLLRVVARLRLEEMSLQLGTQRLGVLEPAVQPAASPPGPGPPVRHRAGARGPAAPASRSLCEPDAGAIRFGASLVEREALLLEPALEQHGPVRVE